MTRPPSSRFAGASHTYEICSQDGTPQALHVRYPPGVRRKRKSFLWFQPDGETEGLNGRPVHTLPFYRSEWLKDLEPGDQVVITEGEKAADALWAFGIVALGTVTGSSTKIPADDAVLGSLTGFDVAVWPDVGTGGQKHMDLLLKDLYRVRGSAEGLSVVNNAALGLIESGADAADWRPDDAVGDLLGALRPLVSAAAEHRASRRRGPGKGVDRGIGARLFPARQDEGRARRRPGSSRLRPALQRALQPARNPRRWRRAPHLERDRRHAALVHPGADRRALLCLQQRQRAGPHDVDLEAVRRADRRRARR